MIFFSDFQKKKLTYTLEIKFKVQQLPRTFRDNYNTHPKTLFTHVGNKLNILYIYTSNFKHEIQVT